VLRGSVHVCGFNPPRRSIADSFIVLACTVPLVVPDSTCLTRFNRTGHGLRCEEAAAARCSEARSSSGKSRTYAEECSYLRRIDSEKFEIRVGFVPNMRVPGYFYVNSVLEPMMFDELASAGASGGVGGFLPAVKQIANVASLPGIVGASIGLPDVHSGYGFAIGNVAAFDMDDPESIVSPGGVGFDINCTSPQQSIASDLSSTHTRTHTSTLAPVSDRRAVLRARRLIDTVISVLTRLLLLAAFSPSLQAVFV
jgi:hypothetical protein